MTIDLLTSFYITLGFIVASAGLGYYVGERGWTGVENDLNNVKLDIAHIQGKLGVTPTTTIVTPVTGGKTTTPTTAVVTSSK